MKVSNQDYQENIYPSGAQNTFYFP